jgi:hypothetical protein
MSTFSDSKQTQNWTVTVLSEITVWHKTGFWKWPSKMIFPSSLYSGCPGQLWHWGQAGRLGQVWRPGQTWCSGQAWRPQQDGHLRKVGQPRQAGHLGQAWCPCRPGIRGRRGIYFLFFKFSFLKSKHLNCYSSCFQQYVMYMLFCVLHNFVDAGVH